MQIGVSYLASLVLKYVLPKGIDWLEGYTESKNAEIKKFIAEIVPGEKFDDPAWAVVHAAIPGLLEAAKLLVATYGGDVPEHAVARTIFGFRF